MFKLAMHVTCGTGEEHGMSGDGIWIEAAQPQDIMDRQDMMHLLAEANKAHGSKVVSQASFIGKDFAKFFECPTPYMKYSVQYDDANPRIGRVSYTMWVKRDFDSVADAIIGNPFK